MVDSASSAAEKIEPSASNTLKAPLFASLVGQMDAGDRWTILDLGPAHTTNIAFFGQFRCRLDIVDLPVELEALNAQEDPGQLRGQIDAVLPFSRSQPTDVVLCWDLLNYLRRPVLNAFMSNVVTRTRPGSLIHALIAYSSPRMPAQPGPYYISQGTDDDDTDNRLKHVSVTREECEAPRYTPDDLTHCIRGFHVERAMLLSNGMQEFLLRR